MISNIFKKTCETSFSKSKFAFGSITIPLPHYNTHKLDSYELPTESIITKEKLLSVFEEMTLMRRMETASDALYK